MTSSTSSPDSTQAPRISTIIATMASPERGAELRRAVASVRAASRAPVNLIVVVNGSRSDPQVVAWLQAQRDIVLVIDPMPSLPNALLRGRMLVETAFFSTLDDDDEYTPGALDLRLAAIEAAPGYDLVVTNGHRRSGGRDVLSYTTLAQVPVAPLAELFRTTWLQSGNALYRAASVGVEFFADYHAYAEWTWLGFRLAHAGRRIGVLETPTFLCHDTPGSLSKSSAYRGAYMALYRRMLAVAPPAEVAQLIQRRIMAAWHDQSCQALDEGRLGEAWRCHLRSMAKPWGLRYLSYSRRLLPGWPVNP